ncbi:MAG: hypothetical protein JWO03_3468 [Bacteroidetes bacterium]|nr:hypothetical protein [Bacteroidota bacterium]
MRKQDQLVDLIHNLTAAEKKFFREYAAKNSKGQGYVKLYEALQKVDNYDAAILCKKLKKTKANLAHEKDYLQEVLFRALREHHSTDADISRSNAFADTLILFQKGCYEMAADLTEKAIKEAKKASDFILLMKFYAMQRNINGYMRLNGEEKFELWDVNIAETEEALNNQMTFWRLQKITFQLTKIKGLSTQIPSEAYQMEIRKILTDDLISEKYASPYIRAIQSNIKAAIYTMLGERDTAVRHRLESLNIQEQYPIETSVDEKLYMVDVQNLINTMIHAGMVKDAMAMLEKIKTRYYHKLPLDKVFLDRTFDAHYVDTMLQLYQIGYRNGERSKEEVIALLQKFDREAETVEKNIMPQRRLMPYYFAAKLAFLIEDYNTSLKWFDKVLSYTVKQGNGDPQTSSRMAMGIIYYQLGSYTVCKSLASSTMLFIKKFRSVTQSEKAVLKFLSDSWRRTSKKEKETALQKLSAELKTLAAIPTEKNIQAIFYYEIWINKAIKDLSRS